MLAGAGARPGPGGRGAGNGYFSSIVTELSPTLPAASKARAVIVHCPGETLRAFQFTE